MRNFRKLNIVLMLFVLLLVGCLGGGTKEYAFTGIITDFNGEGVADVELQLKSGNSVLGVVKTDTDGKWHAKAKKGAIKVTPIKELWEFEPTTATINVQKKTADTNFKAIGNLILHLDGQGLVNKNIISATEVELEATPSEGWVFLGWDVRAPWSPPMSPEEEYDEQNPIKIDLTEAKKVVARFGNFGSSFMGKIELIHSFPYSVEETTSLQNKKDLTSTSRAHVKKVSVDVARPQYMPNELIIRYDHYDYATQSAELKGAGYKIIDTLEILNAYLVETNQDVTTAQMQLSGVSSVEQNGMKYPSALKIPDDELYFAQWHYNQIRLPQAWSVTTGSKSVRVAVVDTGVATEHPELKDNLDLVNAADFTWERTIEDYDGHGTHVAGTIGAATNNGQLVAGVMWDVELLPVKVFAADEGASSWTIVNGMLYAAGLLDQADKPFNPRPVDIINMSLGGGYSSLERDAVEKIYAEGIIMVAAAGNDSLPIVSYPAAHPEVIAVGAVGQVVENDPQGFTEPPLAGYSNYGAEIDVVAPGGAGRLQNDFVWSTYPPAIHPSGGLYGGMGGTSMASPHVAGVIGLMLANGIPRDTETVREILHRTSMEIGLPGVNQYYGHGLINAYWAVNDVKEMRIIQGVREGNTISEVVSEVAIAPKGGSFVIELVPGEYNLMAWVDVNQNGIIDAGDYYNELGTNEWADSGAYRHVFEVGEVAVGEFE